jgi:predicted lipoprotein with Yx(FWY)xxD motif
MSALGIGKLGLGAAAAAALVALVAGCSNSSSSPSTGGTSSSPQSNQAGGASAGLKTKSTSIGTVLVDASGHTVYELVGDSATSQTCTGSCLATWPAVTANGTQVIVNGHPAFTFTGDSSAGQTTGQNVTDQWGRWLALDAGGNPISGAAAATSAPAASTSSAPPGGNPAF